MNRREAIRQISVAGAAVILFPTCRLEEIPQYSKIPLDRKSWNLLKHFAEAILPVDYEAYPSEEPRAIYLLNVMNNCMPKEELDAFLTGFQQFQERLSTKGIKRLDKLTNAELDELFAELEEEQEEAVKSFYRQTKGLAKHHFTSSERFMKEQLDFRFIPGKYQGDVDVHTKIL